MKTRRKKETRNRRNKTCELGLAMGPTTNIVNCGLWHRRIAGKRFMDSISCLINVYFSFERYCCYTFDSIGTIHQLITQNNGFVEYTKKKESTKRKHAVD